MSKEATVQRSRSMPQSMSILWSRLTKSSVGMFPLPDYHHHMARYLTNFGYETVLCGIQHEAPNADLLGYTKILDGQAFDMGCIDFDSFAFDRENAGLVCD